jgi:hypothetical protein
VEITLDRVKITHTRAHSALQHATSDEQTIKRVAVPFHPPITNKLQAVFKKHQIKTRGKLGDHLGNPQDQVETLQKSDIYQIVCLGCSGQSRRSITTR